MTLEQWKNYAEHPYTETRGDRIAVCNQGLLINVAAMLYDLEDYYVVAACGPFTEIAKRETERERKNRLARERRKERKNYNSGSKTDRLEAYGWHN